MSGLLVFSDELTRYDFGPEHPMSPGRVTHTISLADQLGVLDRLTVVPPPPVDLDLLATVHTPDYIAAVRRGDPNPRYGLGTSDNPVFPGMHEIAAAVAMASAEAATRVWHGEVARASNISGGLHHAMPDRTSGFCVYNDVAIAIRWLLDHGCERVGYVDVDVHHGDGVQAIFYDDPRVMTISLHETPVVPVPRHRVRVRDRRPGRGGDGGQPRAAARHQRLRLAAGLPRGGAGRCCALTGRASWSPSTAATPTATTRWPTSISAWTGSGRPTWPWPGWPTSSATGRWISTGGGGYAVTHVVPRAWTHLLSIVAGRPLDPATPIPEAWRAEMGEGAPTTMTDGVDVAFSHSRTGSPRRAGSTRPSWPPGGQCSRRSGWTLSSRDQAP